MVQTSADRDLVLDALTEMSPGMVTSYVVVVECVDADGDNAICVDTLTGQGTTQTLGLLAYANLVIQNDMQCHCQCPGNSD